MADKKVLKKEAPETPTPEPQVPEANTATPVEPTEQTTQETTPGATEVATASGTEAKSGLEPAATTGDSATPPKKRNALPIIIFVLAVIIIILLILIALAAVVNRGTQNVTPTPTVGPSVTTTVEPTVGPTEAVEQKLTVTKPSANQTVNGKFLVEGIATVGLEKLTIRAFDNNDVQLGSTEVTVTGPDANGTASYLVNLQLTKGPNTDGGYIVVFPTSTGATSPLKKVVEVKFEVLEAADRVKVFSPLKNMKYTGGAVLFRGEMQDFFEATMGLRLRGGNGAILYDMGISASSDNYGQFAPFSQMVDPGAIPSTAGSDGKWELYDTSQADGSITVLVSIPVSL